MDKDLRPEYIQIALSSHVGLLSVINSMTRKELLYVLETESQSSRRRTVMDRLIGRLVHLRTERYRQHLKEKYYGSQAVSRNQGA